MQNLDLMIEQFLTIVLCLQVSISVHGTWYANICLNLLRPRCAIVLL